MLLAFLLLTAVGCGGPDEAFPELRGPWLGQTPPGAEAELFAPGIVSTALFERDMAMTPDGNEIYWTVVLGNYDLSTVVFSRRVEDRWTEPEVAPFAASTEHWSIEPFITPDGQRLYFASDRPVTPGSEGGDENIWVADREGEGWGTPRPLPAPVNSTTDGEFYPSVTREGTLYFTRGIRSGPGAGNFIFRSRPTAAGWSEPEKLPAQVNPGAAQYNAFIDPGERFLIIPIGGRADSHGGTDYYISFRSPDDVWTGPINLGPRVNSPANLEYTPYVSPDGRYFFFGSQRLEEGFGSGEGMTYEILMSGLDGPERGLPDLYWIEASFLMEMKPH
jgi:hypothetical protein